MFIKKPSEEIKIIGEYDVVVVGGGVAGVSAALAAARNDKKVCILEREYLLGGLATAGIVAIYLPLCDGMGNQVISGISEELLKKSISYGNGEIPEAWLKSSGVAERKKNRYKLRFDPPAFAYSLDEIVDLENIDVFFGAHFSDIIKENNKITIGIVQLKEGRRAVKGDIFIDATGDADLCNLAGEEVIEYTDNRKTGWYYSIGDSKEYKLNIVNDPLKGNLPLNSKTYRGITSKEITEFCKDSRKMIISHRDNLNKNATIAQIATIPQLRMTRRIKGQYEILPEDENNFFYDSVGMTGDWRNSGPIYYIPYRSLYGKTSNLLVAGRCISSKDDTWDVMRAIPTCSLTGEIVGTAAALALKNSCSHVKNVNIENLKKVLLERGNLLFKI